MYFQRVRWMVAEKLAVPLGARPAAGMFLKMSGLYRLARLKDREAHFVESPHPGRGAALPGFAPVLQAGAGRQSFEMGQPSEIHLLAGICQALADQDWAGYLAAPVKLARRVLI